MKHGDFKAPPENVIHKNNKVDETTVYYTIAGKQDSLDNDGYPVQEQENANTLARKSGQKYMIKIDDRGRFVNPIGIYAQDAPANRWITVNKKACESYISF